MKQTFILSCLFLMALACKREDKLCCDMPSVEMVRTQTQCADAWGYGTNNEGTITNLRDYLLTKKITAGKIEMQANGIGPVCLACFCAAGFDFHVWVNQQYIDSLKKEGFTVR